MLNASDGTGSLVYHMQAVAIYLPNLTNEQLNQKADEIYQSLKKFEHFSNNNIAETRMIVPSAEQINKNNSLKNRQFVEFTTTGILQGVAQHQVSGDGPAGAVYVEAMYDDKSRTVMAITLGNHMVKGVRAWGVAPLKDKCSIVVLTMANERRSNQLTELGFKVIGQEKMGEVWKIYLSNIAKATTTGVTNSSYELLPTEWKDRGNEPNPWIK